MSEENTTGYSRQEYNRTYYEQNREELLRKKREKYHSDAEFRSRVKADVAARRKKASRPKVNVLGREVETFRVRTLAERAGRSVSTVNFWQKHGTIPETPYRTPGGYRLYTEKMIQGVVQALETNDRPSRGDAEFCESVAMSWRRAGVPC